MNKKLKSLIITIIILFMLSSCTNISSSNVSSISSTVSSSVQTNNNQPVVFNQVKLVSIEVHKLPFRVVYTPNESINTRGGELRVTYSDYSVRYISMTNEMIDEKRFETSNYGKKSIFLKYTERDITKYAEYDVEIVPFVVQLESFTLDIFDSYILRGQSFKIMPVLKPLNAGYNSINWKSLNPSIVSVDQSGNVKAINVGETIIEVDIDGLKSRSKLRVIGNLDVRTETETLIVPSLDSFELLVDSATGALTGDSPLNGGTLKYYISSSSVQTIINSWGLETTEDEAYFDLTNTNGSFDSTYTPSASLGGKFLVVIEVDDDGVLVSVSQIQINLSALPELSNLSANGTISGDSFGTGTAKYFVLDTLYANFNQLNVLSNISTLNSEFNTQNGSKPTIDPTFRDKFLLVVYHDSNGILLAADQVPIYFSDLNTLTINLTNLVPGSNAGISVSGEFENQPMFKYLVSDYDHFSSNCVCTDQTTLTQLQNIINADLGVNTPLITGDPTSAVIDEGDQGKYLFIVEYDSSDETLLSIGSTQIVYDISDLTITLSAEMVLSVTNPDNPSNLLYGISPINTSKASVISNWTQSTTLAQANSTLALGQSLSANAPTITYMDYEKYIVIVELNAAGTHVLAASEKLIDQSMIEVSPFTYLTTDINLEGEIDVINDVGGAFFFDTLENEDQITTNKLYSNPQVFTLEAWFRTDDTTSGKIIGFQGSQSSLENNNYDRHIYIGTDGRLYFGVYDTTQRVSVTNGFLNDGRWFHIVATYGGASTKMLIYLNGVLQTSQYQPTLASDYSGYWRFGSHALGGWTQGLDGRFSGSIGEARVYVGTALNSSQVIDRFNNSKIRYQTAIGESLYTLVFEDQVNNDVDWYVPAGVTSVEYFIVGGGGGGGSSHNNGAAGGGAGGMILSGRLNVNAGTNITRRVGGGGSGGTFNNVGGGVFSENNNAGEGSASVFANVSALGGLGGKSSRTQRETPSQVTNTPSVGGLKQNKNNNVWSQPTGGLGSGANSGGVIGGGGGSFANNGRNGSAPGVSPQTQTAGGAGFASKITNTYGSPIAYSVGGDGGLGATNVTGNGFNATGNVGRGGRGAGSGSSSGHTGGNGGAGVVIIRYYSNQIVRLDANSNNSYDPNVDALTFKNLAPTGSNFNGVINEATYLIDPNYKYFNFDGENDKISINNDTLINPGSNNFTLETWVYPTANNYNLQSVIRKLNSPNTSDLSYQLIYQGLDQRFVFSVGYGAAGDSTAITVATSNNSQPINNWYHIVVVTDLLNDNIRMYINGVKVAEDNNVTISSVKTVTSKLTIGGPDFVYHENLYFKGRISEFTYYSAALNETSIGERFTSTNYSRVIG